MPCPQCNDVSHDIHTCPVLSARVRFEERMIAANVPQTPPEVDPNSVPPNVIRATPRQDESVSRIVPEGPNQVSEEERLRLQQESRERDRISGAIYNYDRLIDNSLKEIIMWGGQLSGLIRSRRELRCCRNPAAYLGGVN